MTELKTITLDGIEYVRKDSQSQQAEKLDGMEYVVVRGDRSGVFAGYMKKKEGREVTLVNCRRLWYWDGAASLSQLAVDGVSKPSNCKFTVPATILILDAIEVLTTTEKAKKSIAGVKEWAQ